MIVFQSLYALDVISVGISVGMHYFSAGHIEVPEDEIVASGVKVVFDVLKRIHSLFVVFEGSQVKLFLGVHHLDLSGLVSRCKDSPVRSDANGGQIIDKVDLPWRSLLPGCPEHNGPAMCIGKQIMRIVVVGDGSNSMRISLHHLRLVLLPIPLLIGEFIPALRRGEHF